MVRDRRIGTWKSWKTGYGSEKGESMLKLEKEGAEVTEQTFGPVRLRDAGDGRRPGCSGVGRLSVLLRSMEGRTTQARDPRG
jgi:hypothetical protein